jgi:hypothetical protein
MIIAQALEDPSPRVRKMAVFAVDCLASRPGIQVTLPALKRLAQSAGDGNLRDEARMTIKALPRNRKGEAALRQRWGGDKIPMEQKLPRGIARISRTGVLWGRQK